MRIEVLDSLRGICALGVALHHFRANGQIVDLPLFVNGFLFVDMFFVLSGFVMAMIYFDTLGSAGSVRYFMIKRFARLYPLHLVMLSAFLVLEITLAPALAGAREPFTGPMSLEGLMLNIVLLNDVGLTDGLTWNYPSWSIGAEFFTYICFAALVWAFARRSLWIFTALALAGLIFLFWFSPDYIDATHDFGFIRCLVGFSIGILTWKLVSANVVMHWLQSVPAGWFTFAEISLCAATLAFVWLVGHHPANLISPLIFALVVGCFFFQKGAASAVLAKPSLIWLGLISYSIYMVHALIASRLFTGGLDLVQRLTPLRVLNEDGLFGTTPLMGDLMTVVYVVMVIAAASITYWMIELPGQRFVRGAFGMKGPYPKIAETVREGTSRVMPTSSPSGQ